jgi:hypothetical protein
MTLVAAGKAGELELQTFEKDVEESEQRRSDGEQQASSALKRVAAFLADGNDIYFNGAGEAGLPTVEQAWSINHLDTRYKAQNWKTIDGIATILKEFDKIALEVHGETGPADHAPPGCAKHFGLARVFMRICLPASVRPHRNTVAFFFLGLLNNLTYVVNNAGAGDILPDSIAVIYIINTLPELALKATAPFWWHCATYKTKVRITGCCFSINLVLVSAGLGFPVWAQLLGVALSDLGGGLGEASVLALSQFYDRPAGQLFTLSLGWLWALACLQVSLPLACLLLASACLFGYFLVAS